MGMIDAHPALKASSPQAPPQDQFFGDDYHSGGAYQLMYGFNWMSTNARARVAPSERPVERFDYGTPDGYRFFLELGAAANAQKYFADDVPTCERSHDAPHLRRVLAGAQRAEGSRQHHASGADRRRVVRRAGFLRSVPDVSRAEGEESRRTRRRWSSGRGCTAAGRAATATRSATSSSGRRPRRTTARRSSCRSSIIYLKDKGPQLEPAAKARSCSRPAATGGTTTTVAAERRAAAQPVSAGRTGGCRSPRRRIDRDDGVRRLRQRSRASRCRTPPRSRRPKGTSSWSRISGSSRAGPTCSSTRRAPLTEDLTIAGPDRRQPARGDDRHRRRLGGEADRRLPGRRARSGAEPAERADGRLPDAARRRHPAREVPQQHERARADGAEPAGDAARSRSATSTTRS